MAKSAAVPSSSGKRARRSELRPPDPASTPAVTVSVRLLTGHRRLLPLDKLFPSALASKTSDPPPKTSSGHPLTAPFPRQQALSSPPRLPWPHIRPKTVADPSHLRSAWPLPPVEPSDRVSTTTLASACKPSPRPWSLTSPLTPNPTSNGRATLQPNQMRTVH